MRRPEQELQISVAAFLRVALKPPTIWTAFPAGGGGRVRGAFLKAMGLQAGWPDLIVMNPSRHAYYQYSCAMVGIELKSSAGKLSKVQAETRQAFINAGAHWYLARSVDEVEGFLRGVGIPLYATASAQGRAA